MNQVDPLLHRKLQEVGNLVSHLGEQVRQVSGQVAGVDTRQQQAQTELQQLRADFLAYVQQAGRASVVQRAETRIGVIKDDLDHEFGHHKTVRRTAVGMLQAFDTGLVTEETVRGVSEELMIQTPRYWLAPALVALASWAADDPTLCSRAVDEAFRRSPAHTSLLFTLVLRRQGRQEAAHRWLRHYLLVQDPAALGREFAVILEALAQGAFGPAGRELLATTLDQWQRTLLDDTAARDRQVALWRAEIDSLAAPTARADHPRLAQLSPQWPQLDAILGKARAQQALLDRYRAVTEREPGPSTRLEDAVDDILDQLVGAYDTDELPLRRDLELQHAVVAHDGDMDAARRAYDARAAAFEQTLDYLTVQSASALAPETIGTSPATRRLAVAACREWLDEAQGGFTRDYRAALPPAVEARFDSTHSVAGTMFHLPPWTGSFSDGLPAMEHSLDAHWEQHAKSFLDSLAYPLRRHLLILGASVLAVLLVVGQISWPVALVAAGLLALVRGLLLQQQHTKAQALHRSARQALHQAKRDSLQQLRAAGAELTDWYESYRAADAVDADCRAFITSLSAAAPGGSPFEGRVVDRPAPAAPAAPAPAGLGKDSHR
ncbi:hypothetical protein [Streptomyces albidoflavus]|uniref:hypothetical protein n=1 Tax=Streptomyces albidoflavus TaxID=1886 RepID=UPI0004C21880|nr:hypothetical protein [Streptomyces albidoflavus]RZE39996.1 hypothetical protein C0Q95_20430 [Streptomyces albidoflavus]